MYNKMINLINKNNKIIVIGTNGSGKSTLSKVLSSYKNLKLYHLDKYYWKDNWKSIEIKELKFKIIEILKEDEYIIDGDYLFLLEDRLKEANLVIWLKLPLYLCVINIFKRYIKNYKKVRSDISNNCFEKLSFIFILNIILNKKNKDKETAKLIKNIYKKDVIKIEKNSDLRFLLNKLKGKNK